MGCLIGVTIGRRMDEVDAVIRLEHSHGAEERSQLARRPLIPSEPAIFEENAGVEDGGASPRIDSGHDDGVGWVAFEV